MTHWASAGTVILLLGIVLAAPTVVFIGAAVILIRLLAEIWPKRALDALELGREVAPLRTVVGDPVEVRVSVWNRTRLPVVWASVADRIGDGLRLAGPRIGQAVDRQELRIAASLRPFERVVGRFSVTPMRRGVHEVGPARVRVAELFGTHAPIRQADLEPIRILARPLTAPVTGSLPSQAPLARRRARRSLFPDPSLFAGVRPFQPGDPLKSIHWRASARRGATRTNEFQTKRYEPSLSGQAVLVFDIQTIEGEYWMLVYEERLFEDLAVATLSLARQLVAHETACGFAAANYVGSASRYLFLSPRADQPQVGRLADTLARLTPDSSAPLGQLLAWLPRRVTAGTMILVLTARSPASSASVARRLVQSGFPVHFLLFGPEGAVDEARRRGLSAWSARVESEGGMPRGVVVGP